MTKPYVFAKHSQYLLFLLSLVSRLFANLDKNPIYFCCIYYGWPCLIRLPDFFFLILAWVVLLILRDFIAFHVTWTISLSIGIRGIFPIVHLCKSFTVFFVGMQRGRFEASV